MTGIIAAMQEELNEIVRLMEDREETNINGTAFTAGSIGGHKVVAVLSGVGKVNATISTMLLLQNFDIDSVINCGCAGGLRTDMQLLDTVVATGVTAHDMNFELINQPDIFEADEKLVEKAVQAGRKVLGDRIRKGLVVSGDRFVTSEEVGTIAEKFPEALCAEMEGVAVAQVCWKLKRPFAIIRSISDFPGNEGNRMMFDEYVVLAAVNASKVIRELLIN